MGGRDGQARVLRTNGTPAEAVDEVVEPGAPRCLRCAGPIEPGLAALGSICCHDCRPRTPVLLARPDAA